MKHPRIWQNNPALFYRVRAGAAAVADEHHHCWALLARGDPPLLRDNHGPSRIPIPRGGCGGRWLVTVAWSFVTVSCPDAGRWDGPPVRGAIQGLLLARGLSQLFSN